MHRRSVAGLRRATVRLRVAALIRSAMFEMCLRLSDHLQTAVSTICRPVAEELYFEQNGSP
jgi:hypothetical protein